jgi:hypothetical protein
MVSSAPPLTRDQVRSESAKVVFPTDLLSGVETALLLFCAGFHGRNDGIIVWDAGIRDVVGIDHDEERIEQMRRLYPSWRFFTHDVYTWLDEHVSMLDTDEGLASCFIPWEIVVIDEQMNQSDHCLTLLPMFCRLASKAVVLGVMEPTIRREKLWALTSPHTPSGWEITRLTQRSSGGAYWLTAEPARHRPRWLGEAAVDQQSR